MTILNFFQKKTVSKKPIEDIFYYKQFKDWVFEDYNKQYTDVVVNILPKNKWENSIDDYIEFGGETENSQEIEANARFGLQNTLAGSKYCVKIKAIPEGNLTVISGKKERLKTGQDGLLHFHGEHLGNKIKYDAIIKFLDESPIESMFFLNGDYVFTRFGSPSMSGYNPKDFIQNPTHRKDLQGDSMVRFSGEFPYYNCLDLAKPLIKTMEKILNKTIVKEIYLNGTFKFSKDYNYHNTQAHEFLRVRY